MLHSETTLSRLWCAYELAAFLATKPASRVDVVPLWLAPWILGAMAVDLICGLASQRIIGYWFTALFPRAVDAMGLLGATLFGCSATIAVSYGPAIIPVLRAQAVKSRTQRRLVEQLEGFSLRGCDCALVSDRRHVERMVESVFGGVRAFEEAVRTNVKDEFLQRSGSNHTFAQAALPFLPLAWLIPANVLVCSGMSCRAAARQNDLGDDAAGYVLALALTWGYAILWSWSIYPFIFSVLSKTENRFLGFLAVLGAYGAWGVANAIGCVVAMEAVRSRAWAGVFVWFGAAAAWNACLFCRRPPLRRAKVA